MDYFKSINKKIFCFEWGIPIILGGCCMLLSFLNPKYIMIEDFIKESINFLGVLLGFTLAAVTLFVSSDNNQIEKSKQFKTGYYIDSESISLYRLLIINYSYLITVEAILCVSYFIGKLFSPFFYNNLGIVLNSIYVIGVCHILFLTIRSITDLYLTLTSNKK
jgi:hypothetical protein